MSGNTGPVCSVCSHMARSEIDAAIVAGVRTVTDLARTYGLSRQSIMRHRDNHMIRDLKAAQAAMRSEQSIERGGTLLEEMERLNAEARAALATAKGLSDVRLILSAIGTAGRLLELQAKISGEIGSGGDTVVNITHNDFRTLQVNVVSALEPFPEARAAVLQALSMPLIEG